LSNLTSGLYNIFSVFTSRIPHPGSELHPANQFMLVIMNVRVDFKQEGTENITGWSRNIGICYIKWSNYCNSKKLWEHT